MMTLLTIPFLHIKRVLEQLWHRSQGHMLVTVNNGLGSYTFWATDIYAEDGAFFADVWQDSEILLDPEDDVTISGA